MQTLYSTLEPRFASLLEQAEAWRARWGSANPLSRYNRPNRRPNQPARGAAKSARTMSGPETRPVHIPRRRNPEQQDPI